MANLFSILSLLIAITIHEFAHAFVADRLGDPTPRSQGRLSLNPLRHLDPFGSLMLLFVGFGWGRPVPIDPYNFSSPRRDELLVSLAGPASNLLLALIFSLIYRLTGLNLIIIYIFIATNITLAVFNLLPIPPLDGSKILLNLLPENQSIQWQESFDQYGLILLAVLLFLPINGSSLISQIISPPISFLVGLLLG